MKQFMGSRALDLALDNSTTQDEINLKLPKQSQWNAGLQQELMKMLQKAPSHPPCVSVIHSFSSGYFKNSPNKTTLAFIIGFPPAEHHGRSYGSSW